MLEFFQFQFSWEVSGGHLTRAWNLSRKQGFSRKWKSKIAKGRGWGGGGDFRGEKIHKHTFFSMKIKMMDLWMQTDGTKLIFVVNFSVLDFFNFPSRMPQIAQILVSTSKIFRTPLEISSLFSLAIPGCVWHSRMPCSPTVIAKWDQSWWMSVRKVVFLKFVWLLLLSYALCFNFLCMILLSEDIIRFYLEKVIHIKWCISYAKFWRELYYERFISFSVGSRWYFICGEGVMQLVSCGWFTLRQQAARILSVFLPYVNLCSYLKANLRCHFLSCLAFQLIILETTETMKEGVYPQYEAEKQ